MISRTQQPPTSTAPSNLTLQESVRALWCPGPDSRFEVGRRRLNNGAASTEEYFRMSHQWNVGIGALLLSEFAGSFQSQQAAAAALSARYEKCCPSQSVVSVHAR